MYEANGKSWLYWAHVDNTNEIENMGTHLILRKNVNKTSIWLETRRSLKETSKEVKLQSVPEIMKAVFEEDTDIIDFIVNHGTPQQIQKVQNIINRNNKNCENIKDSNNSEESKQEQSMDIDQNKSPKVVVRKLSDLSHDLIGFICGYLSRIDVDSFKLTSSKISISCLKEMDKYQIFVFNTNQFINNTKKAFTNFTGAAFTMNIHRILPSTKYSYLMQEWQQNYNVPIEYQLLMDQAVDKKIRFTKPSHIEDKAIWHCCHRWFYLLDTRHTIAIKNNENAAFIYKDKDANSEIKNGKMVMLKWYDVFFGKLYPLQILMVGKEVTLDKIYKYVRKGIIATINEQQQWQRELSVYLEKMEANKYPNVEPIAMYQEDIINARIANPPRITKIGSIESIPIMIFSLNTNHPSFIDSNFVSIAHKYYDYLST